MSSLSTNLSAENMELISPENGEAIFAEDILANQLPTDTRLVFSYSHHTGYESIIDVRLRVSPDASSIYVDADVRGSNNSWATSVTGSTPAPQLLTETKIVVLKAIAT